MGFLLWMVAGGAARFVRWLTESGKRPRILNLRATLQMPHIPTRVSPTAQERCHQSVECGRVTTGTHTMTSPMKDADDENQLLASMSAETLKRLKPQLSLVHL